MNGLTPPAGDDIGALVEAARGADEPSEIHRARVRRRVEIQLAAGAGVAVAGSGVAVAGALKAAVMVAVVAGVAGAGAASLYVRHHRAAPPTRTADVVPAMVPSPRALALAPVSPPAAALAPRSPLPPPTSRGTTAHRSPRPRVVTLSAPIPASGGDRVDLEQEVRLLGAVNSALARHDVVSARVLLGEYDRRPGSLAEERALAGILASCEEGRPDLARADAQRFHARWPRSPLSARVDGSCARTSAGRRDLP
jgi:hypothetical protein